MLHGVRPQLDSRRLYVADLARRQFEMESGQQAMQPLGLSGALKAPLRSNRRVARNVTCRLPGVPSHLSPLIAETLETLHFADQGRLSAFGPPFAARRLIPLSTA